MKKLLTLLLLATLFVACSSDDDPKSETFVWNGDWNDPADPNYKPQGYNPIEGEWMDDEVNQFRIIFGGDLTYSTYRTDQESASNSGYFQINDKAYKTQNSVGQWLTSEYHVYQEGSVTKLKARSIPRSGEYGKWYFYSMLYLDSLILLCLFLLGAIIIILLYHIVRLRIGLNKDSLQ